MNSLLMVDMGAVWGGQEIYSRSMVAALAARGWRITCVSPHARHRSSTCAFVPCSINFRDFLFTKRLVEPLIHNHDVVHFNGIRAIYFANFLRVSKPIVGTKHSPHYVGGQRNLKVLAGSLASSAALRKLDWIIAVSNEVGAEIPSSLTPRSSVILNGVSDIGCGRNGPSSSEEVLRVCYVGRLIEQKGIMRLLKAFSLLRNKGIPVKLVLAGDGPLALDARRYVEKSHLNDWVEFLGYIESPEDIYNQSHICVLPSLHEGLPLSLLEALSARCALIAHDVPGVRRVLKNRSNGMFAAISEESIASAIEKLSADRGLLESYRAQARRDYEVHWRIDRMVDQTEAIYYRAICEK